MIFNKKTVLSICFLMLVGAFASAQQQITNFGIVDTNKVYEYFFRTSTGARNYDSKRKEMQDEINKKTAELRELKAKKDQAQQIGDTDAVETLNSTIKSKTEYLRDYTATKNVELQNLKKSLSESNDFYIKLSKIIKRVAENKGLCMVLNLQGESAILWYSNTVDITEDVIKEMNK